MAEVGLPPGLSLHSLSGNLAPVHTMRVCTIPPLVTHRRITYQGAAAAHLYLLLSLNISFLTAIV